MSQHSYDTTMDHDGSQTLGIINSGAFSHSSLPTHHSPYQHTSPDSKTLADPLNEIKPYLNTREETLYMQVFCEEVGVWMDSMDHMKHVRASARSGSKLY